MEIPILKNHNHNEIIGRVYFENNRIYFEFIKDFKITKDALFEIFGNASIKIIESQKDNEEIIIKRGEILEFSFKS